MAARALMEAEDHEPCEEPSPPEEDDPMNGGDLPLQVSPAPSSSITLADGPDSPVALSAAFSGILLENR